MKKYYYQPYTLISLNLWLWSSFPLFLGIVLMLELGFSALIWSIMLIGLSLVLAICLIVIPTIHLKEHAVILNQLLWNRSESCIGAKKLSSHRVLVQFVSDHDRFKSDAVIWFWRKISAEKFILAVTQQSED